MNGAHVVVDGKTVFEECFSPDEIRKYIEYFDRYGCWYNFVGNTRGWARHVPEEQIEPLNESYGMPGYSTDRLGAGRRSRQPDRFCFFRMRRIISGAKPAFQKADGSE